MPVVFVHGAVSDLRVWLPHLGLMGSGYRAIAFTQRYYGATAAPRSGPPQGVRTHADDLLAFIRGLNSGPVHLVGWSSGAAAVLDAVARQPELVRSAFLFEPPFPVFVTDPALLGRLGQDAGASGIGAAAEAAAQGDDRRAVRAMIDTVAEKTGYFDAEPPVLRQMQIENAGTLRGELVEQPPQPPVDCAQLRALSVPVLFVRGGASRAMFSDTAEAGAKCTTRGSTLVIAGQKHMWPAEDPQGFTRAVREFIAGR